MSRPVVTFLLKILVSLGLLLFLFSWTNVNDLLKVLVSAHPSYLVLVLAVYLAGQIISSLRWALLARPLGFKNPFKDFAAFYFIGMFFNLFAPSTVGGDVGRVLYLARGAGDPRRSRWVGRTGAALTSVVADRAIGMAVLVWVGATALVIFPVYSLPLTVRYLTFALALGLLISWVLLPVLYRLIQQMVNPLGKSLALAIEAYTSKRQMIVQTILLSLVVHFGQAGSQVLVGWSLDLNIPWSYSFILYPLVGLFSAIPISFNGIGLREGGYLFMLQRIEVGPEKAVAFGLLWFIIVALESMIGGVVFIVRKGQGLQPSSLGSEIRSSSGERLWPSRERREIQKRL
ncbi:MAG: lysylphosphatidylglycerol synthase transmembrane domain-containing protein [Candidatus Binatia bacterium]